ncbi:hypothetical protein ABH935_004153 [Catenulispora sp. GAS73]
MGSKRIGLRGSAAFAAVTVGAGGLAGQARADAVTNSAVHNGVIAFAAGGGWAEINPDGSDNGGYHLVTPTGPTLAPGSAVESVVFSP